MPPLAVSNSPILSLMVGLCQIKTEEWAVDRNLRRTLEALDEAAAGGAELAITPECVLNGYPGDQSPAARERFGASAVLLDGPEMQEIRGSAARHAMTVVLGIAERSTEGLIHNSAVAINPRGELQAVYRKVHCRSFEDASRDGIFTAGESFSTFPVEGRQGSFTTGLMICFDREIPESVRSLRALGSQLIACPLATNTSSLEGSPKRADNEMITRARAAENEVFIAVVNHAHRFNGGSFIVGPSGEVLTQLGTEPEVAIVTVPLGIVPTRFHSNPLGWMGWGYRRPEIYDQYLAKKA